jgi:hypothetical protein
MKNALIICLFMCLGCSPAARLARLEKKHPELFKNLSDTIIKTDTFTHYDTLDLEIYIDTIKEIDTVNNQTILRIRTKLVDRVVVTRYVNKYIKVNNTKYIKEKLKPKQNWKLWAYLAVIITIFVILWKIFK